MAENDDTSQPEIGDSLKNGINGGSTISFHDAYVLGKVINSGAFGVIHDAFHVSNQSETYAVKVLDRLNERAEMDALHEATILHELQHVPNIVQLIDLHIEEDKVYMVQELARGGDVFDRIIIRKHYTENDARDLAKLLLTTIDNMQRRNIVHRDLKPENLLLKDEKHDAQILLCDFGTAKILPESGGLFTFVGSPAFMAPEIVNGIEYRQEVDVWSIGCILFILLGGYYPFGGPDPSDALWDRILDGDFSFDNEAWDAVSWDAKEMIESLLHVDPGLRWSAADALKSPWFSTPGLEEYDLHLSLREIKKFCARRKLRATMMAVRTSTRSSLRKFVSSRSLKRESECSKTDSNVIPTSSSHEKKQSITDSEHVRKVFKHLNISESSGLTDSESFTENSFS